MTRSATGTTIIGLILAAVLLVSINVLANRTLGGTRIDLTDQQLYTLSDGTRAVLAKIDEPIALKFYYSKRLGEMVPTYGVYAQRVRELLQQYAALSNGKVHLQVLDPQPYSETEDQATAAGLQGVAVEEGGEQVYFGLVATNSTDDSENIPFFQQDRERFLEYDLTKLVQSVAFPKKKVVGLVSNIGLDADPLARMQGKQSQPQVVLDQLRQAVEVRDISSTFDKVPADVDVLMIVQPETIAPKTQYAIDQWVLNGGHALVFVDPNSEFQTNHPSMLSRPGTPNSAQFDALLKAWGITLVKDRVVGDRLAARRVNAGGPGKQDAADYVAWLNLKDDNINPGDPVTDKVGQINVATAGALEAAKDGKTTIEPLLRSSTQSMLIDADKVKGVPDVLGLLRDFKPSGQRYTIAARVTGPAVTAFPDGPPKDDQPGPDGKKPDGAAKPQPDPNQLKASKQPINLIVVADSDILDDRFWVQMQNFAGQPVAVPMAQNADFVLNAVDSLLGTGDLIGLRSRGTAVRPFERVDEIQHQAEDRYQARQKSLQDSLKEAQGKLANVKGEEDADGNVKLTPEQSQAIDQARTEIIRTRTQLRQVQLALRQDIDGLKEELVLLNVGLVPLGVALAAVIVGIVRLQRRKRRAQSA